MTEVSIIIPCYNCADYIAEAVTSVFSQSFRNWEMLLIDDGSTDATPDILKEMSQKSPEKVRVFCLEKNSGGPARPRNFGLEKARSPYIAFLDSDDIWHCQKLEVQLKLMKESDSALSCTQRICFRGKAPVQMPGSDARQIKEIGYKKLLRKNHIANSSVMVAREIMENQHFPEDPSFAEAEAYALWLKLLEKGHKCLKIMSPLMFHRITASGIFGSRSKMAIRIRNVLRAQMKESVGSPLLGEYYWLSNLGRSTLESLKRTNRKPI